MTPTLTPRGFHANMGRAKAHTLADTLAILGTLDPDEPRDQRARARYAAEAEKLGSEITNHIARLTAEEAAREPTGREIDAAARTASTPDLTAALAAHQGA